IFLDCLELPENLVVIGGGPIGCELGQAFSRLGSKVTIVNRGDGLLSKEPQNISGILERRFEEEGIRIMNRSEVSAFKDGKAIVVSSEHSSQENISNENQSQEKSSQKNPANEIPCDTTLIAVGRLVNTEGMSLKTGGIALTEKGKIQVDEYLQSTNKKVYVIGDAAGSYMFSHGAEKMVRQLWRNLLIPIFKKKNTWNDLSWVTFTDPQVAHFGLTEKRLESQGKRYLRQDQDFEHDDRAIVEEYTYSQMSLWLDDSGSIGNKKILSGSMIAPHAGELVQELELAKHAGVSISDLNDRVYPYPVATRINQKAIRRVMEKTRKPWKLKLARMAFRWFH
ncbi:MAG: FAD-dependent oxidoreductase, partial [Pricia sp.]